MTPLILLTGAAGRVGRMIRPLLRDRFRLRLTDLAVIGDLASGETEMTGDLARRDFVRAAVAGVDGIVHMACVHGIDKDFDATLDPNYRATLNLLDEANSSGVGRFVFASSHHVSGQFRRDAAAVGTGAIAPDGFYGLSKAFGEAACAMYSERFGIATLVIRIGNADPEISDERRARMWVGAADLAELVAIGLSHPALRFEIVYGASDCPQPFFANERAFQLGYRARQRALDHLAADYRAIEAMAAADGPDHLGGAYAAAALPSMRSEP